MSSQSMSISQIVISVSWTQKQLKRLRISLVQKKPVKLTSLMNRLDKSDQNKDSKKRAVFIVLVQKQVSQVKMLINNLDKKLKK